MENKIELGLPEKLELVNHGSYIEILRKWFGWRIVVMSAFAVFWDSFLVFWYSMAVKTGNTMALLFPLLHVAVGIGLTYYALAGWFNKTYISVGRGKIEVRHRPFPWPGNKDLAAQDLRQLYAKERISQSRNGTSVTYEVRAITQAGKDIKVVSGLQTSEQALYIEQEIEKYLGIKDVPVKGGLS